MANKYVYEISANTTGYSQGINEAKQSNAEFSSSVDKVTSKQDSLRKALNRSKASAANLTYEYYKLGKERQNSAEGRDLIKRLEEEKKRAAELQDMFEDINHEIKVMASDTAGWDAIKEGITVSKDMMSAFATTIGQATGAEEEMARVVAILAKIQTVTNTVISVGNALQKQSALMSGIQRVQKLALAKATAAETAATKEATVAQKALNMAAKANPYVLLATAIIAIGTALFAFTKNTGEAAKKEKELADKQKEFSDKWKDNQKKVTEAGASIVAKYIVLQNEWKKLSSIHEKNKWIKETQDKFKELGLAINDLKAAEEAFERQSQTVVAALQARAVAAAQYEILVASIKDFIAAGGNVNELFVEEKTLSDSITNALDQQAKGYKSIGDEADKSKTEIVEMNDAIQQAGKQVIEPIKIDTPAEKINSTFNAYVNSLSVANEKAKELGKLMSGVGTTTSNELKAAKGSIEALDNEIKKLQTQARKGLLPPEYKDDPEKFKQKIKELNSDKTKLEIQWGFKEPEKNKTKLDELSKKLADAQLAYQLAVEANDESARQAAQEAYYEAEHELNEHRLAVKIEPKLSDAEKANIKKSVDDIVNDALKPAEKTYDFSFLPDASREEAERTLEQFNKIKNAREELYEQMNKSDANDIEIAEAQRGIDALAGSYEYLGKQVEEAAEKNEKFKASQKKMEGLVDSLKLGADVTQAFGSAMSGLGDAFDSTALKAASIIANTIATILQGYAQATLAAAQTGNPFVWAAFALSGLGQVAAMVAQVKQLAAGSYEDGGVIPGINYTGDRMLARVNSGERVLTAQQNKNFEKLVYDTTSQQEQPAQNNVTISSVKVRGRDLVLAIRNELNTTGQKL